MCSWCGNGWRFEATELGGPQAGRVKAVLHPINAEWEEGYSRPSTGSLLLATRDPSAEDIWAGSTGLYISQIEPDGESRRARFGGYIEKFSGSGGGATTAQLRSIDNFLFKRLMAGPDGGYNIGVAASGAPVPQGNTFAVGKPTSPTDQVIIYQTFPTQSVGMAWAAAQFVNLARGGIEQTAGQGFSGIPTLTGEVDAPDTQPFVAVVAWWDFKNIGQQIQEMVESEVGVKYRLVHTYTNGYWDTVMRFSDSVGVARDYTLRSDREGWQYGLEVDAANKTTRTYGIGSGEAGDTLFTVAYDADTVDNLPEHQSAQVWKDQSDTDRLDQLTRGWVTDHRDPSTVPSMTVVGMPMYDPDAPGFDPQMGFPAPEICQPGDTFFVDLGYGVITVRGIQVRNLGVAWSLQEGAVEQRTIAMQPIIRANDSVRTQTPSRAPANVIPVAETDPTQSGGGAVTADPWPVPGKMSNVQGSVLTEISGMEASEKNWGYAWMFNDEKETPQVYLVNTYTGAIAGSFTPNPGVSNPPWGDPEAIRLSHVQHKLVLADTGDNDNNRPTSGANQPHLLVVDEPKGGGAKGNLPATKYPIAFPGGGSVNVETLLIHPTTDEVLLVTKQDNQARVYSYGPLSGMSTTNNVGVLQATLTDIEWVSDGCHTWNGRFVLFRSATKQPTIVYEVVGGVWKKVNEIATPAMKKSEAIAVTSSCGFITASEGDNSPIYRVLIPKANGATCATTAGPTGTGGGPNGPAVVPGQVLNLSTAKLQMPI